MEKCLTKDLLYNNKTKRCYKSCEKKNKDTHPVTKKCRKHCKNGKTRRVEDFRCVTQKNGRKVKQRSATKRSTTKRSTTKRSTTELMPPPLAKEIVKNFNFINDLVKKGTNKKIGFNPHPRVSDIISIYFHEKYSQHCPMFPITAYDMFKNKEIIDDYEIYKKAYKRKDKKRNLTWDEYKDIRVNENKRVFGAWNKDKFLKNLKLCLETGEQIIMVPLRLPGHLNMLIIKVATREIIRFEPHGAHTDTEIEEDNQTNRFLENLTEDINVYLNLSKKFTYMDPKTICPRYKSANLNYYAGFQQMEMRHETTSDTNVGFCQLWSWFFAECVINNPELPVKEVYADAYNTLLTDEDKFAYVIHGYFLSINEELKKMKKQFSIKPSYMKKPSIANDLFLDYLQQSRAKLEGKPRKTFLGGGAAALAQTPH